MQMIQQFPSWFSKQKPTGKLAIGCAGLFVLCCICSIPITLMTPSSQAVEVTSNPVSEAQTTPVTETLTPTETRTATSVPTETAVAESTLTETAIPTIAVSDTPRPTATEEATALLPGLLPADVTVNLEQEGFSCGTVEQGQLYYTRTCTRDGVDSALRVDIYGREAFAVDFIESTVFQFADPDSDFAASFLGFMATMPYDGAVQEEAQDWVETTLPTLQGQGDVREEVFAGVKYRLFGIPTAITLEMGDLP